MKRPGKAVILSIIMILSSFASAWAESPFSDVSADYWAAEHIRSASGAGVIYGYQDGSFRPKNDVSKQEALAMLYRVLRASSLLEGEEDLSAGFAAQLDAFSFSGSAGLRIPAAYFLEHSVLEAAELEAAGGARLAAPRELIAVWAARAMGYETAPLSVLGYGDTANIEAPYMPCIDALYRFGIMTGGKDGKFMPKKGVVRAEMAAIAVRLLNSAKNVRDSAETKASALVEASGTVSAVNTDRRTLALATPSGTKTLHIKDGADIILNGKAVGISALSALAGGTAGFSCVIGGAGSVTVQTGPALISGTVEKVTGLDDCSVVTVALGGGASASYIYDADSTRGDIPSAGQTVEFISDGSLLLEII